MKRSRWTALATLRERGLDQARKRLGSALRTREQIHEALEAERMQRQKAAAEATDPRLRELFAGFCADSEAREAQLVQAEHLAQQHIAQAQDDLRKAVVACRTVEALKEREREAYALKQRRHEERELLEQCLRGRVTG